jgi:hypothetical protein
MQGARRRVNFLTNVSDACSSVFALLRLRDFKLKILPTLETRRIKVKKKQTRANESRRIRTPTASTAIERFAPPP